MSEQRTSRIEEARRRAGTTKLALGALAVAGFFAALGFAQASHPGSPSSHGVGADEEGGENAFVGTDDELDDGAFGFFGSIGPSGGGTPQVRTSVS